MDAVECSRSWLYGASLCIPTRRERNCRNYIASIPTEFCLLVGGAFKNFRSKRRFTNRLIYLLTYLLTYCCGLTFVVVGRLALDGRVERRRAVLLGLHR